MKHAINKPRNIGPRRRPPMPARLLARIYGVSRSLVSLKTRQLGYEGMLQHFAQRASRKAVRR